MQRRRGDGSRGPRAGAAAAGFLGGAGREDRDVVVVVAVVVLVLVILPRVGRGPDKVEPSEREKGPQRRWSRPAGLPHVAPGDGRARPDWRGRRNSFGYAGHGGGNVRIRISTGQGGGNGNDTGGRNNGPLTLPSLAPVSQRQQQCGKAGVVAPPHWIWRAAADSAAGAEADYGFDPRRRRGAATSEGGLAVLGDYPQDLVVASKDRAMRRTDDDKLSVSRRVI